MIFVCIDYSDNKQNRLKNECRGSPNLGGIAKTHEQKLFYLFLKLIA